MPEGLRARGVNRRTVLRGAGVLSLGTLAGAVTLDTLAPTLWPPGHAVDRNRSLWADELPSAGPPLRSSLEADVVVIGGGLTGLAAAYYLRTIDPTRRVVLLEAHACGNGASGRNGAMLLTSTADRWLTASDDPDLDRRVHRLTLDNIVRLKALAAKHGHDLHLDECGAASMLLEPREDRAARDTARRLLERGIPVEYWTSAQVAERLGTRRYAGALYDPASCQLHPGRLVGLLKTAARAVGVEIYEESPVVHVDEGATVTVTTAAGPTVRAPAAVLATNAYSARLGQLRHDYASVLSYVAVTAPLPPALRARAGIGEGIPFNDSRLDVYYTGPTRDGRIRIGGGPPGYVWNGGEVPGRPPAFAISALAAELERIYPALGRVAFERTWVGAVDYSLGAVPAVGRTGQHGNLYYAIGYSGHGLNLSSVFGRVLADLVAGRAATWQWLPYLDRHPPFLPDEPLRSMGIRGLLGALRLRSGP